MFGSPTDHVYAIVRTRPRATHVVRAGDLAPAGTMLVTPVLATLVCCSLQLLLVYYVTRRSFYKKIVT